MCFRDTAIPQLRRMPRQATMEHVLALLEAGLRPEKDVRIRAELEIRQVLATGHVRDRFCSLVAELSSVNVSVELAHPR